MVYRSRRMPDADNLVSGDGRDGDRPSRPLQRPTMHDVAALAAVSLKTVSRVVNQEAGVSPDLVRRVNQAAARLDYRPNLAARQPAPGGWPDGHHRAAARGRRQPVLLGGPSGHRGRRARPGRRGARLQPRRGPGTGTRARPGTSCRDGWTASPSCPRHSDHSYLVNERRAGLALVFVDRPPDFLDADTVLAANREGARDGVRHLVAHGHRRIAFLGDMRSISTAQERSAGYRDALREASHRGRRADSSGRTSTPSRRPRAAVQELLSRPAGRRPRRRCSRARTW